MNQFNPDAKCPKCGSWAIVIMGIPAKRICLVCGHQRKLPLDAEVEK